MYLFFFQAEDGIRDIGVTGVQTCALPISLGGIQYLERRKSFFSEFGDGMQRLHFVVTEHFFLENVGIDNSKSRCRFWTLLFSFHCFSSFGFLETRNRNFVDCFFWSVSDFTKYRFNCFATGLCSTYLVAFFYSSLCSAAFDVRASF